jgi:hypothetical protein
VDVVAGQLTVSNGLMDDRGYANWVFADPDDQEGVFSPVAGNRLRVSLPGFDLTAVPNETQISLEALPRPDFTEPTAPPRWLWFADPATGMVADLPAALRLDLSSSQALSPNVAFTQLTPPANPSVQIANLPEHLEEHHLLNFLLNDLGAPVGAYGFFARLTGTGLTASEPFLVALNHGLDATTFQTFARRINAAARLPGDYDGDEDVDGTDFLAWQQTLGSTTALAADGSVNDVVDAPDLVVWRANFARITPGAATTTASIPEPPPLAVFKIGACLLAIKTRRVLP